MKSRTEFLSLSEELQFYILRFLPYRDILCCTLVCRALRQMYISYSELQYIVELGGQQLLHVPDTDPNNRTSISQRLKLLRDRAHAWFKFGVQPYTKISIPGTFGNVKQSGGVANGHLCLWDSREGLVMVSPILPKASQQTIKRDPSTRLLHSNPNAHIFDVFMDPAQNLIAIAYVNNDDHDLSSAICYIELEALDGSGVHPQAAGQTLSLSELPGYELSCPEVQPKLKGLGGHIAFTCWRSLKVDELYAYEDTEDLWVLQIWDWRRSTTSSSILIVDDLDPLDDRTVDFCFLGNDRLLVFDENLKLYSIEDMSRAPQFLACFLVPVTIFSTTYTKCVLPMDDIGYSTQPQMQAEQMMWTPDPKDRLLELSFSMSRSNLVFIISTRIFFNTGFSGGVGREIPWKDWGPSNSRALLMNDNCCIGISGYRVLQAITGHVSSMKYRLQVMDFSPLAVERRQGLGQVVKEPSTIEICEPEPDQEATFTTSLPYVKVMIDGAFDYFPLHGIWIEQNRIYIYGYWLKVIEMTPRATEAAELAQVLAV